MSGRIAVVRAPRAARNGAFALVDASLGTSQELTSAVLVTALQSVIHAMDRKYRSVVAERDVIAALVTVARERTTMNHFLVPATHALLISSNLASQTA